MTFSDNLGLILFTAVVTGVLVPVLNAIINDMRNRRQKRLARQSSLLESQAALLDRLAELIWRYWKLALQVAYYGRQLAGENRQKFRDSRDNYDSDQSWEIGRNIYIEISKARRLIPSRAVYSRLDELRALVVDDLDARITQTSDSSQAEWTKLYDYLNGDVRHSIDEVLADVARDLGLSVQGG